MKIKDKKDKDDDDDKKNKTSGPKKSRYNPLEGNEHRFKGEDRKGNSTICKKRYQQISITALGDVNTTSNSSRILQGTS